MHDKYLYYNHTTVAGLNHHQSNLYAFLTEAYLLKRVAIIPLFGLRGLHNHGKRIKNHLEPYFDLDNIIIEGKKTRVILSKDIIIPDTTDKTLFITEKQKITNADNKKYNFIVRNMKHHLWRMPLAENYSYSPINIKITPAKTIISAADKAQKILGNYCCLHVRRNEKLKFNVFLNYYTKPKSIAKKLDKIIALKSNLYVMSDETKAGYFDLLKEKYNLYQWHDFSPIQEAINQRVYDNYFLFSIEKLLWQNANIKIATYKLGYVKCAATLYPNYLFALSSYYHKWRTRLVGLPLRLINKIRKICKN